MSKPQYTYQHGFNDTNSIAIIWCVDDIKHMTKEMEIPIKLTGDQCMEILYDVHRRHDATIGVTWDTLEYAIENYLQDDK